MPKMQGGDANRYRAGEGTSMQGGNANRCKVGSAWWIPVIDG
jgi:hypothetical protein